MNFVCRERYVRPAFSQALPTKTPRIPRLQAWGVRQHRPGETTEKELMALGGWKDGVDEISKDKRS